jgi:hypothetical protein
MKLITCPACEKQISAAARHCPACGQPILAARNKHIWQAIIVLGGIFLFLWLYNYRVENLTHALGGDYLPDVVSGLKK